MIHSYSWAGCGFRLDVLHHWHVPKVTEVRTALQTIGVGPAAL